VQIGSLSLLLAIGVLAAGCGGAERYKVDRYRFTDPNQDSGEVGNDGTPGESQQRPPLSLGPDTLGTGDRIMLVFSGNQNAPQPHTEQIREDGYIKPPLLRKDVLAAGKTIGELQNELHDLYVPAFFSTLTVTVRSEERYFSVGGQVNRPGQIMYRSDMTVLKAIQAAGDFTDFANQRRVLLTRKDGTLIEVNVRRALRDTRYDPPVYPGDIIHVQQRW
jgi:polysaccharide biosynthesis/export protein VpsN